MIRIESVRIEKFRGIRELVLDMKGGNFGICGPNGTGKSGVVDAVEFVLTGSVSRLKGTGTAEISVKSHAPHVKEKDSPDQARVTLKAYAPSLGKSIEISRSVGSPSDYAVSPDDAKARAVIDEMRDHPEFVLSRREIIRYILVEAGQRARDVQELMRFPEIEETRKALTKICNDARKEMNSREQEKNKSRTGLFQLLGTEEANPESVLRAVNLRRTILSLSPLEKIEEGVSFRQGVPESSASSEDGVSKASAIKDLEDLKNIAKNGESSDIAAKRDEALGTLEALKKDASAFRLRRQMSLVRSGIQIVEASEDDACPLCDKGWAREELLEYLKEKLKDAQAAGKLLSNLDGNVNGVISEMNACVALLDTVVGWSSGLDPAPPLEGLEKHAEAVREAVSALRKFVSETQDMEAARAALKFKWWKLPGDARNCAEACWKAVEALPETSKEDEARDFLTRAEERYARFRAASDAFSRAETRHSVAQRVLEAYQKRSDSVLERLYDEVADDFAGYYRSINRDDEEKFEGELVPAPAKLSLNVDFYDYGKFPPGAYHSEGHQDGMGLCLYLALMKRTLGDRFTFCVLDDVLMSVDAGHRREVCKLLKREFPDTQFILTTHDEVWLRYMRNEDLVKDSRTFGGWTVEAGPRVWQDIDVWERIEDCLRKGDVSNAAGVLRNYLEYEASVLADSFGAQVRFRGDGRYDLGDLMQPVISRWRKKVGEGISVAQSWKDQQKVEELENLLGRIKDAQKRTQTEQWAINSAVHYNSWANLQAEEFRLVVKAFSNILDTMRCGNCRSYVETHRHKGEDAEIRCDCGALFVNLRKKKAG